MNQNQTVRNNVGFDNFVSSKQRVRQFNRAPLVFRGAVHARERQRRCRIVSKREFHALYELDRVVFRFDLLNHKQSSRLCMLWVEKPKQKEKPINAPPYKS